MNKKIFIILIMPVLVLMAGYLIKEVWASSNPHSWTDGLVGYWSFDGQYTTSTAGTRDSSGNNYWAEFNSLTPIGGISGQAMSFNGSNAWATTTVVINTLNNFTIEGWAYATTKSADQNIIGNGYTNDFNFGIEGGGRYFWSLCNQSGYTVTANAITPNTWFHWALLANNGQSYYLINGAVVEQRAYTACASSGRSLLIGARRHQSSPYQAIQLWNGSIDEVRIYNRALSTNEIEQHYNQTKRNVQINQPSGTPPVGWWKMDEPTGAQVRDYSVNANNGTVSNGGYGATSTDGKIGKALSFDGTVDDYIQMSAITSLTTGLPFTLSAWVKPENTGNYRTIMGYDSNHRLLISSLGQMLSQQDGNFFSKAAGDVPNSAWTQVVYWNNGATERWYINGQQSGSDYSTVNAEWNAAFKIGQYDLLNYPYKGLVDEVRIYNYARTADQVASDYQAGAYRLKIAASNPQDWSNGLVGYWNFDGSNTTSTIGTRDASGNDNWGTFGGGVSPAGGISGQALSFDGDQGRVSFIDSSDFDISNAVTMEAWVKGDSGNTTVNLLDLYRIDWTNPSNWTSLTSTWDETEQALKVVSYYNAYLTTKIPIDTTKNYYLEYDVMTKNNASKILYAGTHSYATINGGYLPGHPGSYDYFGEVGTTFTAGVWYHRKNAVIGGAPRTGESSITTDYAKWETGTKYATLMFLFNYSGASAQETYIKNLKFYTTESEIGKTNSYDIAVASSTFSGRINAQRITGNIPMDQWNYVVMTYDKDLSSNQQKLYINGSLLTVGTLTDAIVVSTDDFDMYLKGKLDEVRIYNRALSADEVLQHYQQSKRNLKL